MRLRLSLFLGLWIAAAAFPPARCGEGLALLAVARIWDRAPHNAFTDLVRFNDSFVCAFREGADHVSPDGSLRLLGSKDGRDWKSLALVRMENLDLRDAKLVVTPGGALVLSGAAAYPKGSPIRHQTFAWSSEDGVSWSPPIPIGEQNVWLWRTIWNPGVGKWFGVGYDTRGERFARLYQSADGFEFKPAVDRLVEEEYPNESGLVALPDGTLICLLRRDGKPGLALLGRSRPPYDAWTWSPLGARIGGPQMIRLADGRLLASVRLYSPRVRTVLAWVDPEVPALQEALELPSGGDTSYAGMVEHDGFVWVSYYSSHEGKTSIYFAKIGLAPRPR